MTKRVKDESSLDIFILRRPRPERGGWRELRTTRGGAGVRPTRAGSSIARTSVRPEKVRESPALPSPHAIPAESQLAVRPVPAVIQPASACRTTLLPGGGRLRSRVLRLLERVDDHSPRRERSRTGLRERRAHHDIFLVVGGPTRAGIASEPEACHRGERDLIVILRSVDGENPTPATEHSDATSTCISPARRTPPCTHLSAVRTIDGALADVSTGAFAFGETASSTRASSAGASRG